MKRLGLVLIVIAAVFAAAITIAWFVWPKYAENQTATRNIKQGVVFKGQTISTTLFLKNIPLPICNATTGREFDIALLMDVSSSMDGYPLAQEKEAIQSFIELNDFSQNRIALTQFNEQIVSSISLTNSAQNLSQQIQNAKSFDGTSIDNALDNGINQLTSEYHRANAKPLIILFSDGGSDRSLALAQAKRAKDLNILIVTIGLGGVGLNGSLLQELATSGIYRYAQTPDDLLSIYNELALQVNHAAGTNFFLKEPINHTLVPSISHSPSITSTDEALILTKPFITGTKGLAFSYFVTAPDIGVFDVVTAPGLVSFLDCMGGNISTQTPQGPSLLVLPPLPLIVIPWGLLLLLGLVPFVMQLFKRKPTSTISISSPSPAPTRPSKPAYGFENWIAGAERKWASQEDLLSPTWLRQGPIIFVGLGNAGETVLRNISTYMAGRVGRNWEKRAPHIRLMSVRVSEEDGVTSGISNLLPGLPRINLALNADRRRRMKLDQPHLKWVGGSDRLNKLGRALGRFAIFSNLSEGLNESHLWRSINERMGNLTGAAVYVIGDVFSDEASGMIADIAHLFRVGHGNHIGYMGLCLIGQNANWSDNMQPARRNERAFATLRELQRLQRNSSVSWVYAPGLGSPIQLEGTSQKTLFDEILLFDGKGENQFDLSAQTAEEGVLAMLSGCMIAMLDETTSVRVEANRANQLTIPVREGQVSVEQVVGSMGTFALRLPVDEVRRIVEARLMHRFLFGAKTGVLPLEELDRNGKAIRSSIDLPLNEIKNEASEFVRSSSLASAGVSSIDSQRQITDYLERRLNEIESRVNLPWCFAFLSVIEQEVPLRRDEIAKFKKALSEWFVAAGIPADLLSSSSATLSGAPAKSGKWLAKVQSQRVAPEVQSTSLSETRTLSGQLYKSWEEEWLESRSVLDRAGRLRSQFLFWGLDKEYEIYERVLGGLTNHNLEERVWWKWASTDSAPELRLLILPSSDLDAFDTHRSDLTLREKLRQNPVAASLSPNNAVTVLNKIWEAARPLSTPVLDNSLKKEVENNIEELAVKLESNSVPLCSRRILAGWPIPVQAYRYLIHGKGEQELIGISNAIRRAQGSASDLQFVDVETTDRTEYRELHIKHILALRSTDVFAMSRAAYTNPRPDLHVLEAEQRAVSDEEKALRRLRRPERKVPDGGSGISLSPHFVELFDKSNDAMLALGRALLFGVLTLDITQAGTKF